MWERKVCECSVSNGSRAHGEGESLEVMLVDIAHGTRGAEVFCELGVVCCVGGGRSRQVPVDLEPLAALAEVGARDLGCHLLVLVPVEPAPALAPAGFHAGLDVRLDEALPGLGDVFVRVREGVERDAGIREQKEPLVRGVEECIRQQPSLGFVEGEPSPPYFLRIIKQIGI